MLSSNAQEHPLSTGIEQSASSTHPSAAPVQRNPAWRPPSLVTIPSVSMEPTGTGDGDDARDQLVGGRARTDGRPRRDGGRGDVIETQYVRHTDAGGVRAVEPPPSYDSE